MTSLGLFVGKERLSWESAIACFLTDSCQAPGLKGAHVKGANHLKGPNERARETLDVSFYGSSHCHLVWDEVVRVRFMCMRPEEGGDLLGLLFTPYF